MGFGTLHASCPSWRCTIFLSLWASLGSPGWECSVSCTKHLWVLRNLGFMGCKQHILANRSRAGELLGIKLGLANRSRHWTSRPLGGREVSIAARSILLAVEVENPEGEWAGSLWSILQLSYDLNLTLPWLLSNNATVEEGGKHPVQGSFNPQTHYFKKTEFYIEYWQVKLQKKVIARLIEFVSRMVPRKIINVHRSEEKDLWF